MQAACDSFMHALVMLYAAPNAEVTESKAKECSLVGLSAGMLTEQCRQCLARIGSEQESMPLQVLGRLMGPFIPI